MPIHLYEAETGKLITTLLRPGRRIQGREAAAILRRVLDHLLMVWPWVRITVRGDSHFSAPEVHDLCDEYGVDFILGQATNQRLKALGTPLLEKAAVLAEQTDEPIRLFESLDYQAESWSRPRQIIHKAEITEGKVNPPQRCLRASAYDPADRHEKHSMDEIQLRHDPATYTQSRCQSAGASHQGAFPLCHVLSPQRPDKDGGPQSRHRIRHPMTTRKNRSPARPRDHSAQIKGHSVRRSNLGLPNTDPPSHLGEENPSQRSITLWIPGNCDFMNKSG